MLAYIYIGGGEGGGAYCFPILKGGAPRPAKILLSLKYFVSPPTNGEPISKQRKSYWKYRVWHARRSSVDEKPLSAGNIKVEKYSLYGGMAPFPEMHRLDL